MVTTRTVILVQDRASLRQLEELAQAVPWGRWRNFSFLAVEGDLQSAVSACREKEGTAPIGVVALDAPSVLEALKGGADEAAVLGVADAPSFGAFVDRLELRARLRAEGQHVHEALAHAEKLTSLGTLLAGVAHEINNPLTAMHLSIDVARRTLLPAWEPVAALARAARAGTPLPPEALETIARVAAVYDARGAIGLFDDIGSAADAIASIVRDLRVFARPDQEESPELVGVPDIIDQAVRLSGRDLSRHGILERDYAANLPRLVLPRYRVTQVIINILVNATHAIREVRRGTHRVRISVRADDEFVAIAISDTGPGIPPELMGRIFDPFFTTKRGDLGTGLGLSISRTVLRRLGGDLSVDSVYGDGATFLVLLPIPSREIIRSLVRRPQGFTVASEAPGARSILIVESDPRVVRSYVRLLSPSSRLLIAEDGRDAVELLESGSSPDVVLLELELPEFDGRAVLGWIAANRPELVARVLVVTSATANEEYEVFLRAHEGPVLHKPVTGDVLFESIAQVLESDGAPDEVTTLHS